MSQREQQQNEELPSYSVDIKDRLSDDTRDDIKERMSSSNGSDFEALAGAEKLPPVDRGMHAWLFLIASVILEAIVWGSLCMATEALFEVRCLTSSTGYALTFGIFQDYYSEHEPFKGSGGIPVIGTCAMVRPLLLH